MLIQLLRSGLDVREIIYFVIIYVIALMLAFSIHEFMHASVAVWLGDPTPKNMGRLTINPLAHLDPMGTILLLVAGFGWGKPVMYNPSNLKKFKSRRWMNIMVHLAGVTGNFILAAISAILTLLFGRLQFVAGTGVPAIAVTALGDLFSYVYAFSMMLLAFNLIPIPPLDGFHVLEELLPYKLKHTPGYRKFASMSPMILWVIFIASTFTNIPILSSLVSIIEIPFTYIISFICVPFEMLFSIVGL